MNRNHYGQFRRRTEDKPLSPACLSRWEASVAKAMARAAELYGPADDSSAVVAQKMYLVQSGQMSAREAFQPRPPGGWK